MKILKFREYKKNTLRGFIEVELLSGMCIRDLTLHEKNGSRWIGYPSKPYEVDGTTKYQNQVYFPDKEINARFQKQVLTAVDAYLKDAYAT